uniref:Uncharacterized protein n=1 Tax=Rhizophora mucronata TaxID=61149 RepID=A0A2P2NAV7_RHIMU
MNQDTLTILIYRWN